MVSICRGGQLHRLGGRGSLALRRVLPSALSPHRQIELLPDCVFGRSQDPVSSRRREKTCASPRSQEVSVRINEALSLYGLVWVGLQRKEVSPEQAKSQVTAHLECESYCDRWEDCENLLRFIDQEIATQRAATENQKED